MKKCPFCNAEIEENARFCLYCMNSLEEKELIENPKKQKKWWPILLISITMLILVIIVIIVLSKEKTSNDKKAGIPQEQSKPVKQHENENEKDDTRSEETKEPNTDTQGTTTPSENKDDGSKTPEPKPTDTTPVTKPVTKPSTKPETKPSTNNNSNNKQPTEKEEEIETPTTPDEEPVDTVASYLYRDAKYGDDFAVHTDLENAVVITGVSSPSSNGEYKIPETLDNKKVIAIMGLAFSDGAIKDTVKKVIVPSSVKTIWNNAFADCYNLTDIYFCGNSIYVEGNAFAAKANRTGTLTIHCSYNCSDRNYRYYRNSAVYYEAQYEEWND